MASALKIPAEELQAANLAIRSDFKSFVSNTRGRKTSTPMVLSKMTGTASAVAFAAKDTGLREIITKYQSASLDARKKFVRTALQLLAH